MQRLVYVLPCVLALSCVTHVPTDPAPAKATVAQPPTPLADAYRDEATRILEAALASDAAWEKLRYLTDHVGHRLSGSKAMEHAVAWAQETLEADGHTVRLQPVDVPHWMRGRESARMMAPFPRDLEILSLGGSAGTPAGGVTGEVVVVEDFDELEARKDEIEGKIVLFDHAMPDYDAEKGSGYGETVHYRTRGPAEASRLGAVAALVRSVTATSLHTPHTGATHFREGITPIPAVALTIEDAMWIHRLTDAGESVRIRLDLEAKQLPDAPSHNVIAELRGREHPEEVVVIGAHLDSWDVGQGAHDDGAGCVAMMEALSTLRRLDLRPRRTVRVVLFTNEENGLRGAQAYADENDGELLHHVVAIEADNGGFAPLGFRVNGSAASLAQVRDIVSLLEPIGATQAKEGYGGADVGRLSERGVTTMGLWVEGSTYFDYHHTDADTLDKVDPDDLRKQVAAMAVMTYVLADMPTRLGANDGAGTK